jgi:heat shock protein HspQ
VNWTLTTLLLNELKTTKQKKKEKKIYVTLVDYQSVDPYTTYQLLQQQNQTTQGQQQRHPKWNQIAKVVF